MILDDPELPGIAAVLFDEFHERSLDADLGLAFARDAQQGLREDLKILVMSATLDGARVAALLGDAPVIESQGRAYPVETRYLPRDARAHIEPQVADAVTRALRRGGRLAAGVSAGPGRNPPHRDAAEASASPIPPSTSSPLYGALDAQVQDRAIEPSPPGRRKVVLATSIAETSLTIEGVRVVIDSGLARVPRFEPGVGLTRLETVRVSRAAADQRRGRAGRTEPGVCYRLWSEPETASLEAYARPEILSADLSTLRARSGAMGRRAIRASSRFSIRRRRRPMPKRASCCTELSALDADGRITEEGRASAGAAAAAAARAHGGRCRARWRGRDAPRKLPCWSPSAGSAATMSICRTGSISFAAIARAAPRKRAAWRSGGRRRGATTRRRGTAIPASARFSRSPIRIASRKIAAAGRAVSAGEWPRRHARSGLVAGARAVHRRRRTCRHRGAGAHPARGRDLASRNRTHLCGPDRSARRSHRRSRDAVACAAARRAGSAPSPCPNRSRRSSLRRKTQRSSRRRSQPQASIVCPSASISISGATA